MPRKKSTPPAPTGLKALKKVAPKDIKPHPYPVWVDLRFKHTVNNQAYGPGRVRVGPNLARVLMEQERNAKWEIAQFNDKEPPGRIIRAPGKVTYVNPDEFDRILGGAPPYEVFGR